MIVTVGEYKRGCGYRKPGGLYLTAKGVQRPCGKLPIVLGHVCKHTLYDVIREAGYDPKDMYLLPLDKELGCGQLVYDQYVDGKVLKQSRSYRKLNNPAPLINGIECKLDAASEVLPAQLSICEQSLCPMRRWPDGEPALLDWIGKQHYPTADHFELEAMQQGVSRRIRHVPEWFVVGKHWVFLAHELAVLLPEEERSEHVEMLPAIVRMFKPERIEYVVTGDETEEDLVEMVARGITPVKIEQLGDEPPGRNAVGDDEHERFDQVEKNIMDWAERNS